MIQVSANAKHSLVYSISIHPILGPVIKPYVVQLSPKGSYSLVFEHLIAENLKFFPEIIREKETHIIKLLDSISAESITKRFSGKKKMRPKDFFENQMSEAVFKQSIRPLINRTIAEVLNQIKKDSIFLFDHKNPTHLKLEVPENESSVLFHLRRNEQGTNYFITIKCGHEVFNQFYKDTHLIAGSPCWLIVGNKLLHFAPDFDGQKLLPFLQKSHLSIAPSAEEQFYKKFALPLIENYQVIAKGIEIETEQYEAIPILRLEQHISGKYVLVLLFKYGQQLFQSHSGKQVSAMFVKEGNQFKIRKIKRSRQWEKIKAEVLLSLGLNHLSHSAYLPENIDTLLGCINFLTQHKSTLEKAGFIIRQNIGNKTYFLGTSELKLAVNREDDWFDLCAHVRFGEYEIPFILLRKQILAGIRELVLPNGSIAIVPEEWFERLQSIIEVSANEKSIRLSSHHIGLIQENIGPFLKTEDKITLASQFDKIDEVALPKSFQGELRPYQKAGFDWFYFLQSFGFGGCLADDMGLGKTIQTLALLLKEKETYLSEKKAAKPINTSEPAPQIPKTTVQLDLFAAPVKPAASESIFSVINRPVSLLVVPSSLIFNWMAEGNKFAPALRFLNHTGVQRNRNHDIFKQYDVIITTYGTLRNDIEIFADFPFHYIILDESQLIKNRQSQTAKSIRDLHGRYRLTLTGTPIENSIEDLWSQMNFLNPGLLGGIQSFRKNYILPIEKEQNKEKLATLQAILKPFVLRRNKNQVAKDLPEKTEKVMYCEMTDEQKSLYEKVKSSYRNEILKNIAQFGISKSRMHLIKGLTELRQLANHPALTETDYTHPSGKFEEIIRMAETAISEGHKVLLFSQFVRFLTLFRQHFDREKIPYCYLDGSTLPKDRAAQVQQFQENKDIPLFLISLKAGGTGLNLTAADYVFIADPWWNPATEKQAIDRSHRIGQTQHVFSYKFITLGSVEEKILHLQARKLALSDQLIQNEESFVKHLTASDIEVLFS